MPARSLRAERRSSFHLDAGPDPVSLARQSLAGYDSFVSQAIKDWEVPGVAIAIVKNGEVISPRASACETWPTSCR